MSAPIDDTVRLDYLIENQAQVCRRAAGYFLFWGDSDENGGEWQVDSYESPRAAIDAQILREATK